MSPRLLLSISLRWTALACLIYIGGTPSISATETTTPREVVVSYISWFSPVGALNGTKIWKQNGYNYQRAKTSNGIRNYPLVPGVRFPEIEPAVGSAEYYQLERDAARVVLNQMKSAGFDVVTFDMQPFPDYDPAQPLSESNAPLAGFKTFLTWLPEAEKVGIKLAPNPDIWNFSGETAGKIRTLDVAAWKRSLSGILNLTPNSNALWKIDGRPVIIHFGSDCYKDHQRAAPQSGAPMPDAGWRQVLQELRDEGKKFFFIADVRIHDLIREWNKISDGVYIFSPAAPQGGTVDQVNLEKAFTIPYLWTVSPGYYRGNVAYTEPNFGRIHETYQNAIKANARRMFVLTWNDYEEETDIGPTAAKGDCLLRVFAYYNEWFKTGQPPKSTKDTIILAYPMRIPDIVTTKAPRYGRLKSDLAHDGSFITSPTYAPKVFYWANVTAPTTLAINSNTTVTLPAGVSYGELGTVIPGAITAILGGKKRSLPPVAHTGKESQRKDEGGLEFRYVNLTEAITPSQSH